MLHSQLAAPSQCIIRHCVMGGVVQPVYFSLTLIRDRQRLPAGFTCTILPVLSCDCTGNCNGRWNRGERGDFVAGSARGSCEARRGIII